MKMYLLADELFDKYGITIDNGSRSILPVQMFFTGYRTAVTALPGSEYIVPEDDHGRLLKFIIDHTQQIESSIRLTCKYAGSRHTYKVYANKIIGTDDSVRIDLVTQIPVMISHTALRVLGDSLTKLIVSLADTINIGSPNKQVNTAIQATIQVMGVYKQNNGLLDINERLNLFLTHDGSASRIEGSDELRTLLIDGKGSLADSFYNIAINDKNGIFHYLSNIPGRDIAIGAALDIVGIKRAK